MSSRLPLKHIAMLSTHGYFDPIPTLGRTDTGGQVVYVLELAKAIASKGIKVDIFTRWFDNSQSQVDPVPGHPDVNVIRIHSGPWEFLPKEFIYDSLPELSDNMVKFIKENNIPYDIYHGHYVDAGIVTLDVASKFNKPSFFTAHSLGAWKRELMGGDPEEMEKKFNFVHRIAEEQRIFDECNAQTVTSQVQLDKLYELYDIAKDNIEIIPPGVDIHRFYPVDAKEKEKYPEIPDNYIFCLSRIDTNKGHDYLLHAFNIVCQHDKEISLVIGGGSPTPNEREKGVFKMMHELIDKYGIQDRVKMIGYVSDEMMAPYYQYARMFVLPSRFEPFGMTSQEAMACGRTVVASKLGGIRNVITNEDTGLLVDPSDSEEFGNAMLSLLKDDEYNQRLGNNAYKLIVEKYSWEAIADKFLSFYNEYI